MPSRRLFIALELSIAVVEQLMRLQEDLDERLDDAQVRWVHPENIHLPMKYLGPVEAPLMGLLRERMRALVGPLFPFQAECRGLGFSPRADLPRILWAGIDPKSGEVISLLQRALEQELDKIGLAPDPRPFHPRLMLGRIRSRQAPDYTALAEEFGEERFGASTIKDMVLFGAELGPRGPRYTVLDRFELGAS